MLTFCRSAKSWRSEARLDYCIDLPIHLSIRFHISFPSHLRHDRCKLKPSWQCRIVVEAKWMFWRNLTLVAGPHIDIVQALLVIRSLKPFDRHTKWWRIDILPFEASARDLESKREELCLAPVLLHTTYTSLRLFRKPWPEDSCLTNEQSGMICLFSSASRRAAIWREERETYR